MKKILTIMVCILAISSVFLAYDYAQYMFKPRNAIKKILIISEHLEPATVRAQLAQAITDVTAHNHNVLATLVDVHTLGFSFLGNDDTPRQKPVDDPDVKAWSAQVAQADAFIFLVPNYNNGYPAGIKNAIDMLWKEWFNKPSGMVVYSTTHDSSTDVIRYFARVIDKIKSDPVQTVVEVTPEKIKNIDNPENLATIKKHITKLVDELYAGTLERHYFRQLYRSVTDKILIRIIKFFQARNKKPQ